MIGHVWARGAFTLIELVLVILLIGVLSAIAVPKFFDLSSKAAESANLSFYQAFISGLENAKNQQILQGRHGGWLEHNGKKTLYFEKNILAPLGATYADPEDSAINGEFLVTNSDEGTLICAGILEKLVDLKNLKVSRIDGTDAPRTFSQCKAEHFDVCIGKGSTSMFGCEYMFTNQDFDAATETSAVSYYVETTTSGNVPIGTHFVFYHHNTVFLDKTFLMMHETLEALFSGTQSIEDINAAYVPGNLNAPFIKKIAIFNG